MLDRGSPKARVGRAPRVWAALEQQQSSHTGRSHGFVSPRAAQGPPAEPSLQASRESHFLQHLKLSSNNTSGKSQSFPTPFFFLYYVEGHYGKTKHKPEYDAVGKHWDSSTECPRNSIRPMCLEKCYRSLRIKGFAFVVTWTALTRAP